MLLLLNSNLVEGGLPFFSKWINKGNSSDWDSGWYKVMGPPLVNLVIMNEVVSSIVSILQVLWWKILIAQDRGSIFN